MEVLFFVVGSILLVGFAFQCGRRLEEEHRCQTEAYARECVQSYQRYLQATCLASESQRRWYANAPEPTFPAIVQTDPKSSLTQRFSQTLQENGQATVWLNRQEDARVH